MKKLYDKYINTIINKIYNLKDKEDPLYYISRYYKSKAYYNIKRQKNALYTDLDLSLFYNDFSEEFEPGFHFNIEGKIYIHKEDFVKFIEICPFYCWERYLDPNTIIGEKEYFCIKINRFYYSVKDKQLYSM